MPMALNVEASLIEWLRDAGYDAYADVPADRPERFVTVERTGGSPHVGFDNPAVAVQAWAGSRLQASRDITDIRDRMLLDLPKQPGFYHVSVDGLYNWPDPDSRQARYQLTADITTAS